LFTVTVHRKETESSVKTANEIPTPEESSVKSSVKTENQILGLVSNKPDMTIRELAKTFDITTRAVEKQIVKLRRQGRIRRIGPAKGGYWEVIK
jgi:ATP-dependent DNA helicase RecG